MPLWTSLYPEARTSKLSACAGRFRRRSVNGEHPNAYHLRPVSTRATVTVALDERSRSTSTTKLSEPHADGRVLTKRDVSASLFSQACEIDDFQNTDIEVRLFGRTVG